mgnify:CR=1 FL=1
MGLFSNNKKLCPICGNPTPRIFSTKVEGTPICKECDKKADQLPLGTTDTMTLDQFKAYLDFYEANQPLRQLFQETERVGFNSFSGDLILDQEHGLFRLKNDENALVFEMKDLISFQVLEDSRPLFISEGKNLRTFQSDVPEKANAMAPQIGQFVLMRQQFENMENMARMLEKQNITAVILSEQVNGGTTIIEKIEKYSDIDVAICLFTADDIGRGEKEQENNKRARQNVVFETGYFMGKLGRQNIIILADSGIEIPSDLSGIVYTDNAHWQIEVLKELRSMGFDIDMNKAF